MGDAEEVADTEEVSSWERGKGQNRPIDVVRWTKVTYCQNTVTP